MSSSGKYSRKKPFSENKTFSFVIYKSLLYKQTHSDGQAWLNRLYKMMFSKLEKSQKTHSTDRSRRLI